ncbi:meiosis-specific protein MEI4 isoform X2 [Canis lupus baileyi]|uniref:meiosis-specific protein MEI4 isoform X2 n=1 Tax=Canis lupus familiaris TaxID=9615 RepID=UPI0006B3D4D6|nr:meiosis-specific protein MEI4 isoform X2 [Canis lupus familiaris]XP_038410497.1 meiosis-specific protein MEI4 isoform X2 [Canis lupus familiaris]XP_038539918.1 meiosis-specific protein MEI4 isoform X2 [Canis lupus familiaris]XP_048948223.1 meiosis-specific protein MEI4 isoform X2 [Canis lupus dingo]|eukprot:XP_013973591.1 meiosis-specific protein MEI4 isoform X2 [Canis lupus familiaris]
MDDQTWYLRTSKLALALAIIRSTPADTSSREYTEHLAKVVSEQESTWRSKVQVLEAEVLQLRHKLLLSRMCAEVFKSGDPTSQLQAQEPGSSENTLSQLEDSGCDLSNEERSEPSEMPQHFVESCTPTPFLPLPIVKRHGATVENPLFSHMQFLQRLLELKNLTESGSLKTDLSHFENDFSTVSDSVFQLLDGLITFYRKPKFPFSSFWADAVDTLAGLISDCHLSNHILKKCSKKLEEFEKTLLQVILRSNHLNRVQASYVTRYENIFSLFWVLEQLLQKETKEGNTSSVVHDDQEIKKFLQKHDENISQLSDAFPLFTLYLWRLGILLNSLETVESKSLP